MFSGPGNGKVIYLNDRHEEQDTAHEDRRRLYDKRILPLLGKNDLAIFGEKVDSFLWDYYRNLGLAAIDKSNIFYIKDYLEYSSLTKAVMNDREAIARIRSRKPDTLVPYIISKDTQLLAKMINCRVASRSEVVEHINNKACYREIMQALDLPVTPGFRVSNLDDAGARFNYLKEQGFKEVVLKKERSVSGFGIFVVSEEKELGIAIKNNFAQEKSFLLEGFIRDVMFSCNAQYRIGQKQIDFIALSDQLLGKDRVSHKGNVSPSRLSSMHAIRREVNKFSLKLCRYLQDQQCYGLVGFDYLITKDNNVYSTEANCRLNYSTFPVLIVEKLFGTTRHPAWETFTLNGKAMLFERLFNLSQGVFIIQKGNFGIFPIDVGLLETRGEGQFMAIAPTLKQINYYKKKLSRVYENISYG